MTIIRWMCLIFFVCIQGCGGVQSDPKHERRDISSISLTYGQFHHDKGRSPKDLAELQNYEDPMAKVLPGNSSVQKRTREVLARGDHVIIWNAKYGSSEKNARTIVAYQKNVPTKGGLVCHLDGTTETLTPAEFEQAITAEAGAADKPTEPSSD